MTLFRIFFLLVALIGCDHDYAIVAPERIVYVETETEVEVEVDKDPGDIWIESFVQPSSLNGVDILWVIDQSCSMHDDAGRIISGIETMMDSLPPSGWRLNIVSTDPEKVLNHREFPLVPGDTVDDAFDLFDIVANRQGDREAGFSAAYEYIEHNPDSRYWMRSNAALLIVFVSDEDDQSTREFPQVVDFTDWYSGLRPEGSTFLSSIVHLPTDDSVCRANAAFEGKRYIEATNHYSGVVVDICSLDWSAGVADATNKIKPYEEWPLQHTPDPDSIVVFLDGVPNSDWHYDAPNNTVVFDVIPPAAALVEIGYLFK